MLTTSFTLQISDLFAQVISKLQAINVLANTVQNKNTDVSLSNPQISGTGFSQVQHYVESGGAVISILIIMSIVAMSVFLFKCSQFISARIWQKKQLYLALNDWKNHATQDALNKLESIKSPIANIVATAIRLKSNTKIDDSIAREESLRLAKNQLSILRSKLRVIEVIATLSPLLGLLGTVIGMIDAFQSLESAGSKVDPSVLSGGIWEALLTTAAGLVVAIPAVMALNWLEQRIENYKQVMEDAMTQVFTGQLPNDLHSSPKNSNKNQDKLALVG